MGTLGMVGDHRHLEVCSQVSRVLARQARRLYRRAEFCIPPACLLPGRSHCLHRMADGAD